MALDGYGTITWWGFSPARDFGEFVSEFTHNASNEVNMLVVGGCDGRHLLKTIAKKENAEKSFKIFIEENSLELLARQLLLLRLSMEHDTEIGIAEKSEIYSEVLGNTYIRNDCENYVTQKSNEFIEWVNDLDKMTEKFPLCNLSNLKYKERDQLEGIFKFWRNPDNKIFQIDKLWDNRLRHYLGVRYDSRENAYDWEYSMKLKEHASIISWQEYKTWRERGLAFTSRNRTAYTKENKTLASGRVFIKDGERLPRRGYWGDIVTSPYVTFGIESSNKDLFKRRNDMHEHTSTDVFMYNINDIMTGFPNKCKNVEIIFLPIGFTSIIHKKSKYKKKFDFVYFSNSMIHILSENLQSVLKDDSLVMVESTKFLLDLKTDLHSEYARKIKGMAKLAGLKEIEEFDGEEDDYALFKTKAD